MSKTATIRTRIKPGLKITARTLNASKTGRGVKRFGNKKKLFADLGL